LRLIRHMSPMTDRERKAYLRHVESMHPCYSPQHSQALSRISTAIFRTAIALPKESEPKKSNCISCCVM